MNKAVMDRMNEQIQKELYSAYLYLSISAHFSAANLPGFAHWMRAQSQEEIEHAMKFYDFIFDRGGRVTLQAIGQPPVEFGSPLEGVRQALEHEQKVSASIHELYSVAVKENDYPSQVMLHWFIDEQVEEEKSASELVELLKMIGDQGAALIMLDRELAKRE